MTILNKPGFDLQKIISGAGEKFDLHPDAVRRLVGYLKSLGADAQQAFNNARQSGPGGRPASLPAGRSAPSTQTSENSDILGNLSSAVKTLQAKGYPREFIDRAMIERRMSPDKALALANNAPQFGSGKTSVVPQAGKPTPTGQRPKGPNQGARQNIVSARRTEHPENVPYESRDPNDLLPEARRGYDPAMGKINDYLKSLGMEAFPTCTYRNQARQNELYAIGRTKPGQKVTWTQNSPHTPRKAWDIAVRDIKTGKVLDESVVPWQEIGRIGKDAAHIYWGGDWGVRDLGHFQVEPPKRRQSRR
jgi:peptidoglycan LD-endopeptidase CwlK